MDKDPALVDVAVDVFNSSNFKLFKTRISKLRIEFLEQVRSVGLCMSEQPVQLYDMAMKGHFNRTSPAHDKAGL
ncbi:hypothetical protein BCR44DRAFT_38809 [Catenaria anguillulae PL171]|uniref:Uncharacterized protein n=1 Tax=Catenaria anguillulae PL171 TaxID=765915 RepID=A0A1Y2H8Z0_9FUNG|nr:hypothetical protein BCR44DRAFT_38809 [Catenaria anguillulae PL171]